MTFTLLSVNLFKTCCVSTRYTCVCSSRFICLHCEYCIRVYWGYVLNTLMKCFGEHLDALCKRGVGAGVTALMREQSSKLSFG